MLSLKHTLLTLLVFCTSTVFSQTEDDYNRYFSKDQLSFSFVSSQLIQNDSDLEISPFSNGFNLQMMYPILGDKNNVSLALGFGLACQNYYLNSFINTNADSLWFTDIPDSLNHSKYKINTNYLTLPIEIRFRSNPNHKNKSFKIYAGFRAGILINNHTKYKGLDPVTNEKTKIKKYYIDHIEHFDYGVTLRIGYGKLMFNGYYSLNTLFDTSKYSSMTAYELGVTLVLF